MRSDVIGDFQEPYCAVLVDEDDMAAFASNSAKCGVGRGCESISIGPRGSIVEQGPSQWMRRHAASCHCKGTIL